MRERSCGRHAQRKNSGKREADGVDDDMGKAPVSIQHAEGDPHGVAPCAQILLELQLHRVIGVVEGEVGNVSGNWLAGAVVVVAPQGVSESI